MPKSFKSLKNQENPNSTPLPLFPLLQAIPLHLFHQPGRQVLARLKQVVVGFADHLRADALKIGVRDILVVVNVPELKAFAAKIDQQAIADVQALDGIDGLYDVFFGQFRFGLNFKNYGVFAQEVAAARCDFIVVVVNGQPDFALKGDLLVLQFNGQRTTVNVFHETAFEFVVYVHRAAINGIGEFLDIHRG